VVTSPDPTAGPLSAIGAFVAADDGLLYAVDGSLGALLAVDGQTGHRVIVAK
jgi:hypothetical protein